MYKNFTARVNRFWGYWGSCSYSHTHKWVCPVTFSYVLGKETIEEDYPLGLSICDDLEQGRVSPQNILEEIKEYEALG